MFLLPYYPEYRWQRGWRRSMCTSCHWPWGCRTPCWPRRPGRWAWAPWWTSWAPSCCPLPSLWRPQWCEDLCGLNSLSNSTFCLVTVCGLVCGGSLKETNWIQCTVRNLKGSNWQINKWAQISPWILCPFGFPLFTHLNPAAFGTFSKPLLSL